MYASVRNVQVQLNIYVNHFYQFQMSVAGPGWGDTRICKRSQIYVI